MPVKSRITGKMHANLARYVDYIPCRIELICTDYEGIEPAGGQAQQHIPDAGK